MLSTENNTLTLYSEYKITAREVTIDKGNTSESASIDTYFVTCLLDDDYNDHDGCTTEICNGGLCSNVVNETCADYY